MTPPEAKRTLKAMIADTQKAEEKAAGRGFRCTKCGCPDMRVGWIRKAAGGIKRVRVCAHCGTRFPTFETVG